MFARTLCAYFFARISTCGLATRKQRRSEGEKVPEHSKALAIKSRFGWVKNDPERL